MKKEELKRRFIELYLKGEEMDLFSIVNNHPEILTEASKHYNDWNDFIKEIGFLQRHQREQEKFYIYWLLKERKERFGEEALRPKNIEEPLKEKIQKHFTTVKKVKEDLIERQIEEAVFYEAQAHFITGGTMEGIEELDWYKKGVAEYGNEDSFFEAYEYRFLINPKMLLKEDKTPEHLEELVKIGYLTEKDVDEILENEKDEKENKSKRENA